MCKRNKHQSPGFNLGGKMVGWVLQFNSSQWIMVNNKREGATNNKLKIQMDGEI